MRIRLAIYVQYGQQIIEQCHFTERRLLPVPDGWANAWGQAVSENLASDLGDDFAVRFNNGAGLPIGMTVLAPPYSRVEGYVRIRMARLTEFMQELASMND